MAKATLKTKDDSASLFADPPLKQQQQEVVVHRPTAKANTPAKSKQTGKAEVIGGSGDSWLLMIERLSVNKDVDADKLDKLIALRDRVVDREARLAFDAAMMEMQPHLPVITKSGRIIVKEKDAQGRRTGAETQNTPYAKWEKMVPLLKPILHQYGFALTHRYSTAPDGRVRVTAILKGHGFTDDSCYMDLQLDTTGSKNNAQATGSSGSYGRRHTACAVLNIVTKDEDDDGRASGASVAIGDTLNETETDQLIELAEAVGCPKAHLIKHMNETKPKGHPDAAGIATLPRSRFDDAIAALRSYEANKKARNAAVKAK